MYATCLLLEEALTWWNMQVQTLGDEVAYSLSWDQLKELMMAEYCPRTEIQRLEYEFWNLTMEGADITAYTTRFHELSRLVPHLVTPEHKRIERYIYGLAPEIRGMVTSSKPTTLRQAVDTTLNLTENAVRMGTLVKRGTIKKDVGNTSQNAGKKKWPNNKGKQATV